ncbi:hypothetical protein U0070_021732, partial [Myodes glareolus]
FTIPGIRKRQEHCSSCWKSAHRQPKAAAHTSIAANKQRVSVTPKLLVLMPDHGNITLPPKDRVKIFPQLENAQVHQVLHRAKSPDIGITNQLSFLRRYSQEMKELAFPQVEEPEAVWIHTPKNSMATQQELGKEQRLHQLEQKQFHAFEEMIQNQEPEKEARARGLLGPDLEKPQKHSQPGCYPQASDCNTAVRLAKSPVQYQVSQFPNANTARDIETCGVLCGKLMRDEFTTRQVNYPRPKCWCRPTHSLLLSDDVASIASFCLLAPRGPSKGSYL